MMNRTDQMVIGPHITAEASQDLKERLSLRFFGFDATFTAKSFVFVISIPSFYITNRIRIYEGFFFDYNSLIQIPVKIQ